MQLAQRHQQKTSIPIAYQASKSRLMTGLSQLLSTPTDCSLDRLPEGRLLVTASDAKSVITSIIIAMS
jgi:hypothetical protein